MKAMKEISEEVAEVAEGYFASHPFLNTAVSIVGAEAIAGINAAVGEVHQASSNQVNPGYDPQGIFE